MEQYENSDDAVAQLSWQHASIPQQTLPAGPLHAGIGPTGPCPVCLAAYAWVCRSVRANGSRVSHSRWGGLEHPHVIDVDLSSAARGRFVSIAHSDVQGLDGGHIHAGGDDVGERDAPLGP